jgi:hypothetical protein
MSNAIQAQIKSKIENFASELEGLVRRAALDAVADALGTNRARATGNVGRPSIAKGAPKKTGRGGRRPSLASGPAAEEILKHIKSNPGQRAEQVRAALGVAKNVWVPAVKKLIDEKKISKKGQKRATTYTAK